MHKETHESITATDLVRNLSVAIDRVRISRRSLYITKGSQTVAELSPPPKEGIPISKLSKLLKSLPSLEDDAATLATDLAIIRNRADLPENSWD